METENFWFGPHDPFRRPILPLGTQFVGRKAMRTMGIVALYLEIAKWGKDQLLEA